MYRSSFYTLMDLLKLVIFFHDIGIYHKVCAGMKEITEDHYYELMELGLEHIAPIFERDQIAEGEDGNTVYASEVDYEEMDESHWHELRLFSSPDMLEYYRLCRLYELQRGIKPENNPYVKSASSNYSMCLNYISGNYFAAFDSEIHTSRLWIEYCPEDYGPQIDLIYCIYDVLSFYSENLNDLRRELLKGPFVFLPGLPAPKGVNSDVQNGI